ncbi:MAG: hypothetical protein WBP42_08790 [Candidatus Zixiibacteriota bacterium]
MTNPDNIADSGPIPAHLRSLRWPRWLLVLAIFTVPALISELIPKVV